MTNEEYTKLQEIVNDPQGWTTRVRLAEYLKTVTPGDEPKGKRTGAQNASLHLWFRQVAEACRDAGLDAKVLFSKTLDIEVTEDHIKSLWHTTQDAYFKTNSTAELDKQGQIDKIYDTLVRFFAERHELELPPFPSDPNREREILGGYKIGKKDVVPYPDNYKKPLI